MITAPPTISLTFSMADQDFQGTKSLGILNLSTQLAEALSGRPELDRLHILSNPTLPPQRYEASKTTLTIKRNPVRNKILRILWDQWGVYQAGRRAGTDWLMLPKGFASWLCPPPMPLCAIIQDVIPDHYRTRYPGYFSGLESRYFQAGFRASLRHCRVLFTTSEFNRRELQRVVREQHLQSSPVVVMGMGFNPSPPHPIGPRAGILVLASRLPHKLTAQAVDWLDKWQRATGFFEPVHWVGRFPEGQSLPSHSNWRFHLRLPAAEYDNLFQQVRILVYTSEYEGFGMPPAEAALKQVCPVYSNLPATEEVMQGIGFPFYNDSPSSFFDALNNALKLPREATTDWGRSLLDRYNWPNVARKVCQTLLEFTPPVRRS
jgi:glycosyltransferase involved in cell wall biosynthesis